MLANTHIVIANNILKVANSKKIYLINKKRFIWGNIKPDCTPKYKIISHYYDESIQVILYKIKKLASLSVSEILIDYGKGRYSENLGIICHFLCDYFCLPHNQRWRFNGTMKKHVSYENELAKVAKVYKPIEYIEEDIDLDRVEDFILEKLEIYQLNKGYKNDLVYAYFVCNSIINAILNKNIKNEYLKMKKAV